MIPLIQVPIYIYIYTKIKSRVGTILLQFRLKRLYLVLSTLFVIVALQYFAVGFCSFDQLIAYLLIFFNWCDEVGLFFFLSR